MRFFKAGSMVVVLACGLGRLQLIAGEANPASKLDSASTAVSPGGESGGLTLLAPGEYADKVHSSLRHLLEGSSDPVKSWVFLTDKGRGSASEVQAALRALADSYDPRAVRRRLLRGKPEAFDEADLPVHPDYIDALERTGATIKVVSKWLNAVSVLATSAQIEAIARLRFVERLQPVRGARRRDPQIEAEPAGDTIKLEGIAGARAGQAPEYGLSEGQLEQLNLIALHQAGFTGQDVVIGILDTGFDRNHQAFLAPDHPVQVIAEWDFIDDDGNTAFEPGDPSSQSLHGTLVLGVIAGYAPGEFLGAAFDASFVLCKTEDITAEYPAEEDNYVAGLEFAEANGADVVTASLGYIDWYTQEDLDGMTAVTTVAVNTATDNGVHCLNAAGNGGHDANPTTSNLIAPADALPRIPVGAVDAANNVAWFSSDGPTADGRVKPEVLARGLGVKTVTFGSTTGYSDFAGTSAATPLAAGVVACLVQADPDWSVDHLRERLFETADYFVQNQTFDPLFVLGYGVMDAFSAWGETDCNGNGVPDELDIAGGTSPDCNGNHVPDECDTAEGTSEDCNGNDLPDECDIADGSSEDCQPNNIPDECEGAPWIYGDVYPAGGDGVVDLDDIVTLLAAFADPDPCTNFPRTNLFPCDQPCDETAVVDLDDLLAALQAFAGVSSCPDPCP